MSSIFTGKLGLRHQFAKLTAADLAAANSQATAKLLGRMRMESRLNFMDNTLDTDIAIYLVHPQADPSVVANRLFWIEIPSNRVVNYDVGIAPGLMFDPGTRIYVTYIGGAAPTTGAFRVALWG